MQMLFSALHSCCYVNAADCGFALSPRCCTGRHTFLSGLLMQAVVLMDGKAINDYTMSNGVLKTK